MKKQTKLAFGTGILIGLLFIGVGIAVPPATKYNPGDVTDPGCGPTDTNCSIELSSGASASNGLSIDGTSGDIELGGNLTSNTFVNLANDGSINANFPSVDGEEAGVVTIFNDQNGYLQTLGLTNYSYGGGDILSGIDFNLDDEDVRLVMGTTNQPSFDLSTNSIFNIGSAGFLVRSPITEFESSTELKIRTPSILSATATNGQVLTLQDNLTGEVEYQSLPTANYIKLGEVDFSDINAAGAGNTSIPITLSTNDIPAGAQTSRIIYRTNQAFVSGSSDIDGINMIGLIKGKLDKKDVTGQFVMSGFNEDIEIPLVATAGEIEINLNTNNADFTAGNMSIVLEYTLATIPF